MGGFIVRLPEIHPRLYLADLAYVRSHRSETSKLLCTASERACLPTPNSIYVSDDFFMSKDDFEKFAFEASDRVQSALMKDEGPLIVHCRYGRNRSVAAIVAYAILKREWKAEDAIDYVSNVRGGLTLSNPSFRRHLLSLSKGRMTSALM